MFCLYKIENILILVHINFYMYLIPKQLQKIYAFSFSERIFFWLHLVRV